MCAAFAPVSVPRDVGHEFGALMDAFTDACTARANAPRARLARRATRARCRPRRHPRTACGSRRRAGARRAAAPGRARRGAGRRGRPPTRSARAGIPRAAAAALATSSGSSATGSPPRSVSSSAATPRRSAISATAAATRRLDAARASRGRRRARRAPGATRPGITLTAPGETSSVPTVATVSGGSAARDPLDREDDLGGGGERVAAELHRDLAGVTGLAGQLDPRAARRRDALDDAEASSARRCATWISTWARRRESGGSRARKLRELSEVGVTALAALIPAASRSPSSAAVASVPASSRSRSCPRRSVAPPRRRRRAARGARRRRCPRGGPPPARARARCRARRRGGRHRGRCRRASRRSRAGRPSRWQRPQVAVGVERRLEAGRARPSGDERHRGRLGRGEGGAVGAAARPVRDRPQRLGARRSGRRQASAYSASGLPSIASTSG